MRNTDAIPFPHVRLNDLIEARGLKKQWVADRLGMTPSHLSRLLRGERVITETVALKAAELFGVDVRELVPGVDLDTIKGMLRNEVAAWERASDLLKKAHGS